MKKAFKKAWLRLRRIFSRRKPTMYEIYYGADK
jgi:hypothetical protein